MPVGHPQADYRALLIDRGVFLWALLMLAPVDPAVGYGEYNYPGLAPPSLLAEQQMSLWFTHRFLGALNEDPLKTYFGLSDGANVAIGARYAILDRLTVAGASQIGHREFVAEAAWARELPDAFIDLQGAIQLFAYEEIPGESDWTASVFPYVALASTGLPGGLRVLFDIGYDFASDDPAVGIGADVALAEWFNAYAEFCPSVGNRGLQHGDHSYTLGFSLSTYGHQFLVYAGNNPGLGPRRQMSGTSGHDPRLGFMIFRMFSFGN